MLLYVVHGAIAADLPLSEAVTGDVLAAVAGTRFGVVSLARLGLLMVAAGIWLALRPSLARAEGRSLGAARAAAALPGWAVVAGGVVLVALLATPGLAGHAGTTPRRS